MKHSVYILLLCFVLFVFDFETAETFAQTLAKSADYSEYAAKQYELGNQLLMGDATKPSESEALQHFKEAAKHGHLDAMFVLGRMYSTGQGVQKDIAEGMSWLEKATGSDGYQNPGAAEMLAEKYGLNGLTGSESCNKGVYWYEKAARGSESAAGRLAWAYANGQCVARDFAKAAALFLPLAEKGDALAQITLADFYFKGNGVAQDNSEAYFWARCLMRFGSKPNFSFDADLEPILALEFPPAEREKINERLIEKRCIRPIDALIVPDGLVTPIDKLKTLATAGNTIAQDALGTAYLHDNQGMRKDYTEAVAWYRRAAEQGYAEGQYHLGRMYFDGIGVSQDDKESAKYIHAAAGQGHDTAAYDLSNMYASGRGVPKDETQAYVWCKISTFCQWEKMKINLAPEQLSEAEKRYLRKLEHEKNLPRKNYFNTPDPIIQPK
jgi:TPR repeat protein